MTQPKKKEEEREREREKETKRNGSTRGRGLVHSSNMQVTAELYSHDAFLVLCMHQTFILYKLNLSPTSTPSKETRKTKEVSDIVVSIALENARLDPRRHNSRP